MKSKLNLALLFLMTSALVWGQKSREYKRINSIAYYDESEVLEDSYMQEMCVLDLADSDIDLMIGAFKKVWDQLDCPPAPESLEGWTKIEI